MLHAYLCEAHFKMIIELIWSWSPNLQVGGRCVDVPSFKRNWQIESLSRFGSSEPNKSNRSSSIRVVSGKIFATRWPVTSTAMSLATELVAGGFAGAVGIMATQPLDTIRHSTLWEKFLVAGVREANIFKQKSETKRKQNITHKQCFVKILGCFFFNTCFCFKKKRFTKHQQHQKTDPLPLGQPASGIRLQSTSCALGRVQPYAGIADCAKSMLQHEGWVVVSNIFYFHPYLGKIPILTNMFQRGWNHQLEGVMEMESWMGMGYNYNKHLDLSGVPRKNPKGWWIDTR